MKTETTEYSIGFSINTTNENEITDNIKENYENDPVGYAANYQDFILAGYVTDSGDITELGWEVLSKADLQIEMNALQWIRENSISASDEGHGDTGLVGTLCLDINNAKHISLLQNCDDLNEYEKYGIYELFTGNHNDLDAIFTKDISSFGEYIRVESIEFFEIPSEVIEKMES